jgi:hypothetical protein
MISTAAGALGEFYLSPDKSAAQWLCLLWNTWRAIAHRATDPAWCERPPLRVGSPLKAPLQLEGARLESLRQPRREAS